MGVKAPLIHRICMMGMLEYHLSVMVMVISSSDTIPSPSMAGNETKAVKRSILRNTPEEGDVFWLTLDEIKQRKLAYGMDKMLEVFLNDNISEYFFLKKMENG